MKKEPRKPKETVCFEIFEGLKVTFQEDFCFYHTLFKNVIESAFRFQEELKQCIINGNSPESIKNAVGSLADEYVKQAEKQSAEVIRRYDTEAALRFLSEEYDITTCVPYKKSIGASQPRWYDVYQSFICGILTGVVFQAIEYMDGADGIEAPYCFYVSDYFKAQKKYEAEKGKANAIQKVLLVKDVLDMCPYIFPQLEDIYRHCQDTGIKQGELEKLISYICEPLLLNFKDDIRKDFESVDKAYQDKVAAVKTAEENEKKVFDKYNHQLSEAYWKLRDAAESKGTVRYTGYDYREDLIKIIDESGYFNPDFSVRKDLDHKKMAFSYELLISLVKAEIIGDRIALCDNERIRGTEYIIPKEISCSTSWYQQEVERVKRIFVNYGLMNPKSGLYNDGVLRKIAGFYKNYNCFDVYGEPHLIEGYSPFDECIEYLSSMENDVKYSQSWLTAWTYDKNKAPVIADTMPLPHRSTRHGVNTTNVNNSENVLKTRSSDVTKTQYRKQDTILENAIDKSKPSTVKTPLEIADDALNGTSVKESTKAEKTVVQIEASNLEENNTPFEKVPSDINKEPSNDTSNAPAERRQSPTMFCTECGKKIMRTAKFCNFCGNKINYKELLRRPAYEMPKLWN